MPKPKTNSLKKRISQYSIGLVLIVVLLQLSLFAVWEFFAESHDESTIKEFAEHPPSTGETSGKRPLSHKIEELLVLCAISAVTLPLFMLLIHYMSQRIFNPIEKMAHTALRIGEGRTHFRLNTEYASEELDTLATTLNNAFDRYQGLLEKAEQFSADASHQLRTPLAVLRSSGELALSRAQSAEEYREVLSNMLEESARLEHIVEQLLLLTRLSSRDPRQQFEQLDIAKLVRQVGERFLPLFEDRRISIELEPKDNCIINGNEALVIEAISNLVNNALDASSKGDAVRIHNFQEEGRVIVEVLDSGRGIPPEQQEIIFSRFHSLADNPASGSGLGLAIVQAIAEFHEAVPELTSVQGEGSAFRLCFPSAGPSRHFDI